MTPLPLYSLNSASFGIGRDKEEADKDMQGCEHSEIEYEDSEESEVEVKGVEYMCGEEEWDEERWPLDSDEEEVPDHIIEIINYIRRPHHFDFLD
jgi:hypothetical protein